MAYLAKRKNRPNFQQTSVYVLLYASGKFWRLQARGLLLSEIVKKQRREAQTSQPRMWVSPTYQADTAGQCRYAADHHHYAAGHHRYATDP